jgi:hypothetical protein
VEKYQIINSGLDKHKTQTLVMLLDVSQFTSSRNVKGQSNRCQCSVTSHAVCEVSFTSPYSACKISCSMFFEQENSDHHIKLAIFRELTEEDNMLDNSFSL